MNAQRHKSKERRAAPKLLPEVEQLLPEVEQRLSLSQPPRDASAHRQRDEDTHDQEIIEVVLQSIEHLTGEHPAEEQVCKIITTLIKFVMCNSDKKL